MPVKLNDLEWKLDISDIPIAVHAPGMHLSYDLDIIPMGNGYLVKDGILKEVDFLERYVLAPRMNTGRRTDEVMLMKCILILQV
jgi:hypothetical protein